jgi:hypothetical protein
MHTHGDFVTMGEMHTRQDVCGDDMIHHTITTQQQHSLWTIQIQQEEEEELELQIRRCT